MFRVIASILLACAITPPVFGQDTASKPPKAPHSLRLLCVDAVPAASRLVVMEKTDQGWAARWRLTVSAVFLTDVMGFSSRSLALAVDTAATCSSFPAPTAP